MSNRLFIKPHGSSLKDDFSRLEIFKEICMKTGSFITAEPILVDKEKEEIHYKYIKFPKPSINEINNHELWEEIGKTLARIHITRLNWDKFNIPISTYPLESLGVSKKEQNLLSGLLGTSWFHSDFWHGNVFLEKNKALLIIDPLPSKALFEKDYFFANGSLDVATMYMSLLLVHPLHKQLTMDLRPHIEAADIFLAAYLTSREKICKELPPTIRRLARLLALRFIGSYHSRLISPIAKIKIKLALRNIRYLDNKIHWT